ncbi:hypothetical protein [Streptomyces sp. RerS4]|uniref:hypothetical protein n=1 Tax=Streptomyces sp. RerS4 TaxID=2942449 RepID=UPI00201BC429|nr:hypothetical protein [Streptomyces sp. RerS4]UQX02646.1 hypothetical protein M4D82_20720 [Streptomyces sp. RerS4]
MSVNSDTDPAPAGDTTVPTLVPQLRPTPQYGGDVPPSAAPGFSRAPGTETRTPSGGSAMTPWATLTPGATAGPDAPDTGGDPTPGRNSLAEDKDRDGDGQGKPAELCREYKSGKISADRRERLVKLAGALQKVSRFCETALDAGGAPRGNAPKDGSADQGSVVVSPPPVLSGGSLGFRTH